MLAKNDRAGIGGGAFRRHRFGRTFHRVRVMDLKVIGSAGWHSMSLDIRRRRVRRWGLPFISTVATILIAATVDPEKNWARPARLATQ